MVIKSWRFEAPGVLGILQAQSAQGMKTKLLKVSSGQEMKDLGYLDRK